jgi:hypothetical protein
MDFHQPPHPTTPTTGDDNVDVSGAKLPDRSFSVEFDDTDINAQI